MPEKRTLIRTALALTSAMLLAACAQTVAVNPERVSDDYTLGGGQWDTGGGISIVARVVERKGQTVVCGVWTTDQQGAVTANLNERVIETASIFAGDTRLVQNLSFMPRTYQSGLKGALAGCVAAGEPWQEAFAETGAIIRIPRVKFLVDDRASSRVVFRQTNYTQAAY